MPVSSLDPHLVPALRGSVRLGRQQLGVDLHGLLPAAQRRSHRPDPQPRKETTSRPWNRRPPDATAGQAPTQRTGNQDQQHQPASPSGQDITPVKD